MRAHEFLDNLVVHSRVGFGALGRHGSLGYEGKQVVVDGEMCHRSLSTHPPARVICRLDRRFDQFRAGVAINRDVVAGTVSADFTVVGDGRELAYAEGVAAGAPARTLTADVQGIEWLELIVSTRRWRECHAVWLNPAVEQTDAPPLRVADRIVDCLERTEIEIPALPARHERCIATIASQGFEGFLDGMLASLRRFGCCNDALRIVLVVDDAPGCREVALSHGAVPINCRAIAAAAPSIKAALYSVGLVIDADAFVCLDADTLVLGDLRPLFDLISACTPDRILVCREANMRLYHNLAHALSAVYRGTPQDLASLLGTVRNEADFSLVVNDGLFAGSRHALRILDSTIRAFTGAADWVNSRPDVGWRNQFIFNLALARLDCGLELRPTFNVQLHAQQVELPDNGDLPRLWNGESIRMLHFSGKGKKLHPPWYSTYCRPGTDQADLPERP